MHPAGPAPYYSGISAGGNDEIEHTIITASTLVGNATSAAAAPGSTDTILFMIADIVDERRAR